MKNRLAIAFLFFASLASSAYAQEALLSGRVTHEDGAPVANATVSIPELGLSATTGATSISAPRTCSEDREPLAGSQ